MDNPVLPPVAKRKPRTSEEVLRDIIGGQAVMIARLTATVEQIPAMRDELEQLRDELAALKPPAPAKE